MLERIENIDIFFHIFMYELELELHKIKDEFLKINFQSDEANTDYGLKIFLKKFILENFTSLPKQKMDHLININIEKKDGKIEKNSYMYSSFNEYKIVNILLPDELNDELKTLIKREKSSSIYTNPDLLFIIESKGKVFYKSIELKSTKNDAIPGSSVQQVKPEEWVLFVKHNEKEVKIVTGQYINSINNKLPFPDRSPRPIVSFKELNEWNEENRNFEDKTLTYDFSKRDIEPKLLIITDWNEFLIENWLNIIFSDKIKKNETWFNNTLRKFAYKFISILDDMPQKEKNNFKEKLKKLIDSLQK